MQFYLPMCMRINDNLKYNPFIVYLFVIPLQFPSAAILMRAHSINLSISNTIYYHKITSENMLYCANSIGT